MSLSQQSVLISSTVPLTIDNAPQDGIRAAFTFAPVACLTCATIPE